MGIQKKLVCIQILFGTIISKKKVGGGGGWGSSKLIVQLLAFFCAKYIGVGVWR